MAYSSVALTVTHTLAEGQALLTQNAANVGGLLTNADQTAVAAAVATLVADGATPTQAHVTDLNTAWGTLVTNSIAQGDAVLMFNPTNVKTVTILSRIFDTLKTLALGGLGGLTP